MVFSSITFIFYLLPLFWIVDSVARASKGCFWRNLGITLVSLLFYTWGEGNNVFLLILMAAINYGWGFAIDRYRTRLVLGIGIAINLLILFKYKYFYWLLNISEFGIFVPSVPVNMPLGISFFTFHAISYLVDIHRRDIVPARTGTDFFAYFCMFPHLVAGPIVRYAQIREQLSRRGPDWDLFNFGVYRFLLGLNKKVIIANSVSIIADTAFARSDLGVLDAWMGIIAYTIQIYFDFSAYSDMAIGLAAMAGFRFHENFQRPYSATSIKDFWRRWHISLSSWFRDYVYIPLGGNRGGQLLSIRNLLIVFFLCGLWHGANLTFIVWGLWHGVFLMLERFHWIDSLLKKLPLALRRVYMLIVVMMGWVFFRADTLSDAMIYISNLFSLNFGEVILTYYVFASIMLGVAVVLCVLPDRWMAQATSHAPHKFGILAFTVQVALSVTSIVLLLVSTRNPFIYFNF